MVQNCFFRGLVLAFLGARARKEAQFLEGVTGMVRTHDRFSIGELALKIGRTELETELLIARIIQAPNACGAPTQNQVVFVGESVPCMYCGVPLAPR